MHVLTKLAHLVLFRLSEVSCLASVLLLYRTFLCSLGTNSMQISLRYIYTSAIYTRVIHKYSCKMHSVLIHVKVHLCRYSILRLFDPI